MARDLKAKIRLTADTKNASKNIDSFNQRLVSLGKNVIAPIVGFAALAKAVFAVGAAMVESQRAVSQLAQSFKVLGDGAGPVVAALQDQASQLSALTEFSDAEIVSVQTRISAFTKEQAQIEALTKATLDLAVGRSIGLVEASEAIAKSFGTAGNVLQEYGISVDGAAASTDRMTAVTAGVARLWDDAATGAASNFSAQVSILADNLIRAAGATAGIVLEQDKATEILSKLNQDIARQSRLIEEEDTFLGKLVQQFSGFGTVTSQLGVVLNQTTLRINEQSDSLKVYGPQVETAAERTKRITKELGQLNKVARAFNEIFQEATQHLTEFKDAADVPGIAQTKAELAALGVILDESVNLAIEKNNALLIRADELYRLGQITRADFNEVQERVAIENSKLNGTFVETVDAVGGANDAVGVYSETLRQNLLRLQELGQEELRFAGTVEQAAERRTAARLNERNLGSQTIFGQRTTVGGTFFFPDEVAGGANGHVTIVRPGAGGGVL